MPKALASRERLRAGEICKANPGSWRSASSASRLPACTLEADFIWSYFDSILKRIFLALSLSPHTKTNTCMRHHRVMGSPAWTSKLVTSCVKLSIPQNGSSTMVNLWMRLQASQWMHMRWDPYKIAKKPHQESQDGKTRASKPIKVFMKMGWNRRVRFKLGLEVMSKNVRLRIWNWLQVRAVDQHIVHQHQ